MSKFWIVWNPAKNEGFITNDEDDATFVSTGDWSSLGVSVVSDAFRETYGEHSDDDLPMQEVDLSVRSDYRPAFDTPTTAGEALAWLTKQGEPTCMTFRSTDAKRAAELLSAVLEAWGQAVPYNSPITEQQGHDRE